MEKLNQTQKLTTAATDGGAMGGGGTAGGTSFAGLARFLLVALDWGVFLGRLLGWTLAPKKLNIFKSNFGFTEKMKV